MLRQAHVTVESSIEYGRGQVRTPAKAAVPLLLDLYLPTGAPEADRPVVIVIPGGGFTSQSRTDPNIVRIARRLAERGIAAASIDYRRMGQQPVPSARVAPLVEALPPNRLSVALAAAVDDALTATDHLAGLGIGRRGLVGSSAGAITADYVGYALDHHGITGPDVTFVASLWGGIFVPPRTPTSGPASGAGQLGPRAPALFAVHGDADDRVPVRLSDELVARAQAVGLESEYHRIPGGGHGYEASGFFTRPVSGAQTPFELLLAFAERALARGRGAPASRSR